MISGVQIQYTNRNLGKLWTSKAYALEKMCLIGVPNYSVMAKDTVYNISNC
jgi:hypothetical protein